MKQKYFFRWVVFFFISCCYSQTVLSAGEDQLRFFRWVPNFVFDFVDPLPQVDELSNGPLDREILYGRDLFIQTAYYLGPKGIRGQYLGNRMNCQNCHLDAGTRPFGGYLRTTHGRYPQYRERNDNIITLADRINQCIQRPHHGKPLPLDSREMRALLLYFKWLGKNSKVEDKTFGDELIELPFISRAADPKRGAHVFEKHCKICHGSNGQGKLTEDEVTYLFPPLWGPDSFTIGSSMHRVRKAAAFIKMNMPFGTTWRSPVLTSEEAYDVAAYITDERINDRPHVDVSGDYPKLEDKPLDYPYGPYTDLFSEEAHRFGPFQDIKEARKKIKSLASAH